MSDTKPILCGKCNVPIKIRTDDNGQTLGTCPVCGNEDGFDEILREVARYNVDQSLPPGTFSGTAVRHGGVTIKSPPQRHYRWIAGG